MTKLLRVSLLITVSVVSLVVSNMQAALTDGLVSYWPLDVNDSGTSPDQSFTNTMTIVGTPVVGSGQFSNAFTFDGSTTLLTNQHTYDTTDIHDPLGQSV